MFMFPVERFAEIDSTNSEARRRVDSGYFSNCWIVADAQTAGRGRRGRSWVSNSGNVFATALFQYDGTIADASKIPFVAGLAVSDVFSALAPEAHVAVKWPNDVRCNGAKLSGILVEAGALNERCWIAAGIGINVSNAPGGLDQETSSLSALRGDNIITASATFESLREYFAARMEQFSNGFDTIRADWMDRAEGIMEPASAEIGNETIEGVFEGLGKSGEFLLRQANGVLRSVSAGDVSLIADRTG